MATYRVWRLPTRLKIVAAFLVLHSGLYGEGMNEALMKGVTFDVRWVFHLIGCALLVLAIARPSKCVFFLIGAYCIFVPTRMLADEYVAGYGLWETASLLLRNIILTVPMYLAALLLIAEGSYYFKAKPGAPI